MSSDPASLVYWGRLFQRSGEATEKARRPWLFMLKASTASRFFFEDLRSRAGWQLWRRSLIYTSDLSWNEHINETAKKASKRLYFLVQLKRAKLPCRDLVLFYATCIRSILVYAAPVFFMLCPSSYSVSLSGFKKGHYQSFAPVCLMTRHLMKLVFRPLFHIARTYVTRFLTLPSATMITNLTSY